MKIFIHEELMIIIDKNRIITYDTMELENGISVYKNGNFSENIDIEDISDDIAELLEQANEMGEYNYIEDLSIELKNLLKLE